MLALGSAERSDERFVLDLVRLIYGSGPGASAVTRLLDDYVSYMHGLQRALEQRRGELALDAAGRSKQERERLEDLFDRLGLRLRETRGRWSVEERRGEDETTRAEWLLAVGIDRASLAQRLNTGERVRLSIPTSALPLPVKSFWDKEFARAEAIPILHIVLRRRSALLYVALAGLDEETQALAVVNHEAWTRWSEDQVAVLAAFANSLRVRSGSIVPPGGADAVPVWEELVDEKITRPQQFVDALLEGRAGRLAYFFDAVAQLDPQRQAWVLAGSMSGRDRVRAVERRLDHFANVEPEWVVPVRPFHRPASDPALAVLLLDMVADGTVGPAWWPRLLDEVVDDRDWPAARARVSRPLSPATLDWALDWIFDAPAERAHRWRLLRFAQRRFADAHAPATSDVEMALRGFDRMPALMLALERMGVVSAPVYGAVASRAYRLTAEGAPAETVPMIRQWQGAVALLEQVVKRRPVPQSELETLLLALAKATPSHASGAEVTSWWFEQVMPALGVTVTDADDDERLLRALVRVDHRPVQTVRWEGLSYRVDWAGPAARDALAIRRAGRGPTFATFAGLYDLRRDIEKPASMETIGDLARRSTALADALATLTDDEGRRVDAVRNLERAAKTLAKIRRPKDLSRVPRQRQAVAAAVDLVASHVFPSVAYALAVSPTPQPQVFSDIAGRHDFGVITTSDGTADADAWRRIAWDVPVLQEGKGLGASIRGALLLLDVPLADARLFPVAAAESPSMTPAFNRADRNAYVSRLAIVRDGETSVNEAEHVLEALRRARALVSEWSTASDVHHGARRLLLSAAVSITRTNLMLWAWSQGRAASALAELTPTDRYHLGADQPLPVALGVPAMSFDGCVCMRPPARVPIEAWGGRGDAGHLVAALSDLTIRLVELLDELELPALLVDAVLPAAIQDVLDRTIQFAPDDWEALTSARLLQKSRVEEYLLKLVTAGVLAPPIDSPEARQHR